MPTLATRLSSTGVYQVNELDEVTPLLGGSVLFPSGSSRRLRFPSDPNLQLGTGDFTVDFWMKATGSTSYTSIFDKITSTTVTGLIATCGSNVNSGAGRIWVGAAGTATTLKSTTNVVASGAWTHVAIVKNGSNGYLFINGVLESSATDWNLITSADLDNGRRR